jgi:hypothetical protein
MADLNLYLTSLEPNMAQTNYTQSIGGYISTSLVYPQTTLASTVGLYDTSISLSTPSGGWTNWLGVEYINVNGEIIKVSPITNGVVSVVQRGYNGIINMHVSADVVRAVSARQLFNGVFNGSRKQYRCIAVKNDSASDTAFNVSVFLQQNSRNSDSSIRIALERPTSQYLTSTSTSRTTTQLVDTSLIGLYPDNHFAEAFLKPVGETSGGIVRTFDSSTGTFVFYSSFSTSTTNVSYEVFPSPAQRAKSGIEAPVSGGRATYFTKATEKSPIHLSSTGDISDTSLNDMLPNYVFYVWVERTIAKGAEAFDANDVVLTVHYDTV